MKTQTASLSPMPSGFQKISGLAVLLFTLGACGPGDEVESDGTTFGMDHSIALPRTGQIRCTDNAGATIACADTGQDGDLRVGAAWPDPRFTVDGSGDCITDNLTGLMWARDDGGFLTWHLGLDFANNLDLCGFTDWRMPNRKELISLINHDVPNPGIWLLDSGFRFQVESFLWSSSSVAGKPCEAWTLIVLPGVISRNCKSGGNYVLPVRTAGLAVPAELPMTGQTTCSSAAGVMIPCAGTGQDGDSKAGVTWPASRFTLNGTGGCITDKLTGLTWMPNPDATTRTWQEALDFANSLELCGATDWRLPNFRELESLVNLEVASQAGFLNSQGFTGVQEGSYWASTIFSNAFSGSTPMAWVISMVNGGLGPIERSTSLHVLPVRAGQ